MDKILEIFRIIWIALAVLGLSGAGMVFIRASRIKKHTPTDLSAPESDKDVSEHAAESLSQLIKFQTISNPDPARNQESEWVRLRDYLKSRYPLVHENLERTVIGKLSLVYHWKAPNPEAKPLLFCAHLDVVPAGGQWERPAFSGEVADGKVWGRGALDCKHILTAIMESAERLCERGFVPDRDIWFAFGHDEEVGGSDGAAAIARFFAEQNLHFDLVLDEGDSVAGEFFSLKTPTAVVSVAEKGFMNIKLTARAEAGHASSPPRHTALGVLSQAICRLEYKARRPRLTPLARDLLMKLAPELSYIDRLKIANLWLFKKSVLKKLLNNRSVAPLVHTTIAATMSKCGTAPNVLPSVAEAIVNIRLLHGDTAQDVVQYVKDLTHDLGIEVMEMHSEEASPVSYYKGAMFEQLSQSIRSIFGKITVVPYLLFSGTDALKYSNFSTNIFRFCPFVLSPEEAKTMHNVNESVRVESLGTAVAFYEDLMLRLAGNITIGENT